MAATRSWGDDLEEALLEEHGEERGAALYRRYGDAFPPAYRADWVPRSALADIARIEELDEPDDLALRLYRPLEAPHGALRAKVFRPAPPLALSDLLPLFEDMGVEVADERPYAISPRDREGIWIYDFGLTYSGEDDLEADAVRDAFQDAFIRAWRGDAESDGYNRLVLRAGLTWRETTVLRAIGRYLRQAGTTFSDRYVEQALVGHPHVARLLVDLVLARFDPEAPTRPRAEQLVEQIERGDRRGREPRPGPHPAQLPGRGPGDAAHQLLPARDGRGRASPTCRSSSTREQLAWLPLPRPRFEIFVYSPRTEGVHLRGGKVARGGIRWSDRREDFRTEVLGLMKAQMVKNAVIVPVGAKGGFVAQAAAAGRRPRRAAGRGRGLLPDVHQRAARPDRQHRGRRDRAAAGRGALRRGRPLPRGGADKGTATLSDVANAIAGEYGFWLGDAFASGGSSGYDHKKMGITARGAWESVKRHFRELGHDVQEQDFTVVGVGDMSGDVFGNGMLLSKHIRLIGAFDHRHVFLDPDPDAAAQLGGAPAPVQARALVVGRLRPRADLGGRRRVPAHRQVDPAVAAGARRARRARRGAGAQRADPGDAARRRWTCSGTAASAPT